MEFFFNGGVQSPSRHQNEKFLMFFVVGGKEVSLYNCVKNGLVSRCFEEEDGVGMYVKNGIMQKVSTKFVTTMEIAKVFVSYHGLGVPKRYQSFYIRLKEAGPTVVVRGMAEGTSYFFKGVANFLTKKEAIDALHNDETARDFLIRQPVLPVHIIKELISVDRSQMRQGVRAVRIKQKGV